MNATSSSNPEKLALIKLVQPFIDGSLSPDEATRVVHAIKVDLVKFTEVIEQYLSGSIDGKQLDDFRESLIDNGSPAESYLEREPRLWKAYDPFIENLSLFEPDPAKRAAGDSLIDDEELRKSAKTFLEELSKAIAKL